MDVASIRKPGASGTVSSVVQNPPTMSMDSSAHPCQAAGQPRRRSQALRPAAVAQPRMAVSTTAAA